LLISYFGEKDTEACGCCDVCLSKNSSGLSNRDFNMIRDKLLKRLSGEQPLPVNAITESLPFPAEKSITVIRFLVEHDSRFHMKDGEICMK